MQTSTFLREFFDDYPVYAGNTTTIGVKNELIDENEAASDQEEDADLASTGEPIEVTETKNGDAATDAQEGNFGKRSYAYPGKDDENEK